MPQLPKHLFRFGHYCLNATDGTLSRDHAPVDLGPKAIDTLREFVRNPGRVLTREHFMQTVWNGTFVESNAVERQISDLRKALGNGDEKYIETLRSRGYRFVASVDEVFEVEDVDGVADPIAPLDTVPEPPNPSPPPVSPNEGTSDNVDGSAGRETSNQSKAAVHSGPAIRVRTALLVFLAACLAVVGWVSWPLDRPTVAPASKIRRSLMILDFRDHTRRGGTEWLATALGEMLRTELSVSRVLRIISGEDSFNIGRELSIPDSDGFSVETLGRIRKLGGADFVVSGSYATLAAKDRRRLRLDIKVQDAVTGELVASFGESTAEEQFIDLIPIAAGAIRKQLGLQATTPELSGTFLTAIAMRPEARRLYFEGLGKLRLLDAQAARPSLEAAQTLEPKSPLVQAALAETLTILGYQRQAREYAKRSLELASDLPNDDRLAIEGRLSLLTSDWPRTIQIYSSLWTVFPDRIDYAIRLAEAQAAAGKPSDAAITLSSLRKIPAVIADDPRIDLAEAAVAEGQGDFRAEQRAAVRAADKARSLGAQLVLANALLRDSWASNSLSDRNRAIETAENARRIFLAAGDPGGEARANKNLADAVDDSGDHVRGAMLYEQASESFRRIGYEGAVAMTLNNLAYAIRSQGDLERARKMFVASYELSRKLTDEAGEARALNGVAIVLWRQGKLAEAERTYLEALKKHRQRGNLSGAATVLGNVAIVQQDQGRLAESKASFDESLRMLREQGDRTGEARTIGNLGELAMRTGDLATAKARFLEQLRMGKAIPEEKQVGYALHGLGTALLAEGDIAGARSKLSEAIAIRARLGELGLEAESRVALAEALIEEPEIDAAIAMLQEAVKEFEHENETDQKAVAESILATCMATQRRLSDASVIGRRLRQAVEKVEDTAARAKVWIGLGKVATALGKVEVARVDLQRALGLSKKYGFALAESEIRLAMAQLSGRDGVYRSSVEEIEETARRRGHGLVARRAALGIQQLRVPQR